jgi:hypothetical protein
MSTEEPTEVKSDFHVKLQSDTEPPSGDPGRSLSAEVRLLREQIGQLCQAVRGLVTLISVLDKKVDTALKGGNRPDFGVI